MSQLFVDFFEDMMTKNVSYNDALVKFMQFMIEKNKRYGDSALKPLNVFSKLKATNSIEIRLDDKLSRIIKAGKFNCNDTCDLFGYLVLYCISNKWKYSYWSDIDLYDLNVMELIGVIKKSKNNIRFKVFVLMKKVFDLIYDNEYFVKLNAMVD